MCYFFRSDCNNTLIITHFCSKESISKIVSIIFSKQVILHTLQHEHFCHLFENKNILYLVKVFFKLTYTSLTSWGWFWEFNNNWDITVILFSWSLKPLCIIIHIFIDTCIMFLYETCKYSFSIHSETSSKTSTAVVGNRISLVTEVSTPLMLESCVLGRIDVDS